MPCKCPTLSPFRWREHTEPSIFMADASSRARGKAGMSLSQLASQSVENQRSRGLPAGYLSGISRDIQAERERLARFVAAAKRDGKGKR